MIQMKSKNIVIELGQLWTIPATFADHFLGLLPAQYKIFPLERNSSNNNNMIGLTGILDISITDAIDL